MNEELIEWSLIDNCSFFPKRYLKRVLPFLNSKIYYVEYAPVKIWFALIFGLLVLFFLAEVAAVSMITTSESLSETATLLRSEFQQWADTGTPSPENRTCQTSTMLCIYCE